MWQKSLYTFAAVVFTFVIALEFSLKSSAEAHKGSGLELLFHHLADPGLGKEAETYKEGTVEAIQRSYDGQVARESHKALGTRGARSRVEGRRMACDRSGGKCALCAMTRGRWCEEYYRQDRVPWKPAPRGNKDCPRTKWGPCNGVGNCHYDIGVCQCPAGWRGDVCDQPDKRPCTNRHRQPQDPLTIATSHVGPDGLDLDLGASGWTASRCAGFCDDDRGSCWCPPSTKYGRKPPPPDSPPWVRYSQKGRVIREKCKPAWVSGKDGTYVKNDWGQAEMSVSHVMAWCDADDMQQVPIEALRTCTGGKGCQEEGLHGGLCSVASEETCLNQCSGHGECDAGFCRCHPGWYGHDCARKKAGEEMEPGLETTRPWLKPVVMPIPAASAESPLATTAASAASATMGASGDNPGDASSRRMRPLIYVYDMPPEFTSRMHQYKLVTEHCGYRKWTSYNATVLFEDAYSLEVYLHEMLSVSRHRTFDPEEADFFYVPVYYTCWMWPVNGWADMPYWGAPNGWHRYSNAAHMWLAAQRWIQTHFPYWDRRGGRDHIWLTNHDEGACYMPTEIYNTSIMLTHWGRLDPQHTSNTAYVPDNYTAGVTWPGVMDGKNVKTLYEGHPCYDPKKDLVVPGFKLPEHYRQSPLLGNRPYERDILLYLRGDVGKHRLPNYSRGIRQKLYNLTIEHRWAEEHRIFVGETTEMRGPYGQHLARSTFCAVVPGDGFSTRFEDAVLHGCLPLIIMDRTHAVFESILDIDSFSLRIQESAVNEHLPNLLKAISRDRIERMQRRLVLVWHRFAYGHGPLVHASMRQVLMRNRQGDAADQVPPDHPYQPVHSFPVHTDAFATIIQWLHSRIEDTRTGTGVPYIGV